MNAQITINNGRLETFTRKVMQQSTSGVFVAGAPPIEDVGYGIAKSEWFPFDSVRCQSKLIPESTD